MSFNDVSIQAMTILKQLKDYICWQWDSDSGSAAEYSTAIHSSLDQRSKYFLKKIHKSLPSFPQGNVI